MASSQKQQKGRKISGVDCSTPIVIASQNSSQHTKQQRNGSQPDVKQQISSRRSRMAATTEMATTGQKHRTSS